MRLRLGKCDGPVRQWRDAAAACGLLCAISSTTTARPYAEAEQRSCARHRQGSEHRTFWDERVIRPIVSATQRLAKEIQHLQSGDFRLYCLYVVAALVVLLIAIAV